MNRLRPFLPFALIVIAACGNSYRGSYLAREPGGRASYDMERPGLGTEWGENRWSPVRQVPFDRDDPASPTAVATLRYDDRAGVAQLTGGRPWPAGGAPEVLGGALSIRLLDAEGSPLPQFQRGGAHFVEGRAGERYTIEIENRSGVRFEAVATVDGLDVMDGERGSFEKRGYIIERGGRLRIDGFRRTLRDVAAFRFGAVSDSYAALKGDDRNVGVIGVAFFCEHGAAPPWLRGEAERRMSANPFPARFATPPSW
jgi:hypothetical protein